MRLVALRKAIRLREIWVEGGNIWRSLEDDLPADFGDNRDVHYQALSKPRFPVAFIAHPATAPCRGVESAECGDAEGRDRRCEDRPAQGRSVDLGAAGGQAARTDRAEGAQGGDRPPVGSDGPDRRVKDVDRATHFTAGFSSVASRTITDARVLCRRLLCLYGLGTNVGIKRVADGIAASGGVEVDSEAVLRRTRRLFINRDNLRSAIRTVVNKMLRARDVELWGAGTSCASDSRKFGSWSANVMTEFHQRYGGPGIMVYWHVERKSVCIYSQVTATSASEAASVIEGLLWHLTSAEIDRQYTHLPGHRRTWPPSGRSSSVTTWPTSNCARRSTRA